MLTLAEHLSADSTLVAMLVSAAIDGTAATTLEWVLDRATVTTAGLAEIDLNSLSCQRALGDSPAVEGAVVQSTICDVAAGRISFGVLEGGPRFPGAAELFVFVPIC